MADSGELDDDVDVMSAMERAQGEYADEKSAPTASFEPDDPGYGRGQLMLDPTREITDPFTKTRTHRMVADALGLTGLEKDAYIEKSNAEMAQRFLKLDEDMFGEKGFYTNKAVDHSWKLVNLAKQEAIHNQQLQQFNMEKMIEQRTHRANIAGLEKKGLKLNLDKVLAQQSFHEQTRNALDDQIVEGGKIESKDKELRENLLDLMGRIYKGLDHTLASSSGIFDLTDTETIWDKENGEWVTTEETSGTGIAAVGAAVLGIAANFALTIASEGKVPMVMDRLVFGIADRSLKNQRAKIKKYQDAGESVQTLYGTLLTHLSSEKAANNAYYALVYKRIEHDFGVKAATAETGVMRNAFKIAQERSKIQGHEWEMKAMSSTKADARASINQQTDSMAKAATAMLQWRSAESQRLDKMQDDLSSPQELAAKYNTDPAPKIKDKEQRWIAGFSQNVDTASKVLVLIESLEAEYNEEGQEGYTNPDTGKQGGAWNLKDAALGKWNQLIRKGKISWTREHGGPVTKEYILDEYGKMSAQRYGKNSDSGNQAVDELNFWIERFYTGEMSLSAVKAKVRGFLNDNLYGAARRYENYRVLGNPKAKLYAGLINQVTGKAFDGVEDFKSKAFNASSREKLWDHLYVGLSRENPKYREDVLGTLQIQFGSDKYEPSTYESIYFEGGEPTP